MARKRVSNKVSAFGPVQVVYRTKNGRGHYRIRWREDGQACELTRQDVDAANAVALETAQRLASNVRQPLSRDSIVALLVSRAIDPSEHNWDSRHGKNLASIARTHLVPAFGSMRCKDLTPSEPIALLKNLAEVGNSPHTIRAVYKVWRATLAEGISLGIWTAGCDLDTKVRLGATTKKKTELGRVPKDRIPTEEEVASLTAALYELGAKAEAPWGLMAEIASETGVRWAELLAVRPIDVQGRMLRIEHSRREEDDPDDLADPKTVAGMRDVPMSLELTAKVEAWCKGRERRRPMFTTRTGTAFTRSNWSKTLRRARARIEAQQVAARAVGGPVPATWPEHLKWHSLRHYRGSRWINLEGVPVSVASEWLGHSNPAITMRLYVHAGAEAKAAAIARLDALRSAS